jgi:hypothetical protein
MVNNNGRWCSSPCFGILESPVQDFNKLQDFSNLFVCTQKKQTSICKSGVGVDVGGRGKHKSLDIHNLTSQKERDPRTKYWVKVIGGIQKDGGTWAYHEPWTIFLKLSVCTISTIANYACQNGLDWVGLGWVGLAWLVWWVLH